MLSSTTLKPLSQSAFESTRLELFKSDNGLLVYCKILLSEDTYLIRNRLKNGSFFNKAYFDNLLEEIREVRASERRFYQKITDIYATEMDYDSKAEITQTFFAEVQNKLHFAIHGHTAAELIVKRADGNKDRMGLTLWKNAPHGKILKPDVVIAKNYLTQEELRSLDRIITMYLDYAEDRAKRNMPMTMKDWAEKLKAFLQFNERDILNHPGKVSQEVAKAFAESEFEKYHIVQDRLFESDPFQVKMVTPGNPHFLSIPSNWTSV